MSKDLLNPNQLAEIRRRLPVIPRADMSLTEQDRADLLAHLDAREAQVRQALAGLLLHSLEKLPPDSPYRILGEGCNRSLRTAAKTLGIDL